MSFSQTLVTSIKGMFPGFLFWAVLTDDPLHHCRATVARRRGSSLARIQHEHPDQPVHSFSFSASWHHRRLVEWQIAPFSPLETDFLQLP